MISAERVRRTAYVLCRYFVAFAIVVYGLSKLTGAQFQTRLAALDTPLGELSGMTLTWHYFAYSEAYGAIIAFVQIAGGVLLLFRKTTLLGTCVLFGVMSNIILVNIFYDIASAWVSAFLLTSCLLFILWQHREELVQLFWTAQNEPFPYRGNAGTKKLVLKNIVRVGVLALPVVIAFQFSSYLSTPISGAWNVEKVRGEAQPRELPERIYFESSYANQSNFRYEENGDTRTRIRHYEVEAGEDDTAGELNIWSRWMNKDAKFFTGQYRMEGDTLWIRGQLEEENESVRLVLSRRHLAFEQ